MKWLSNLSARERRLASITGAVVLLVVGYMAGASAVRHVRELDGQVESREMILRNESEQAAMLDEVNTAYAAIEEQHSSEWTQAEIHDRLRDEIVRLSQRVPPPPNQPLRTQGAPLVRITRFPEGELTEGERGYREYKLRIDVQNTTIGNLTQFIQRLYESPQQLRVDFLDVDRPNPENFTITATLDVTRPVVGEPRRAAQLGETPAAAEDEGGEAPAEQPDGENAAEPASPQQEAGGA